MNDQLPKDCYVMLHIGTGPSDSGEKTGPQLVVTGRDHLALTDDNWIERLDEQLAKHIQMACEPPHYKIDRVEQDRHLYAFVRPVPAAEKSKYEGMEQLFAVIALSRLIHPTSIGDRYCARVFHFDLKDSAIQAIEYRGISPDISPSSGHLDWLSVEDATNLRSLMPWLSKHMHGRVHRAYWNHEYLYRNWRCKRACRCN